MKFTLEITMGNDAMRTPEDIATALGDVASRVQAGYGNGNIRDLNGNAVGTYEITGQEA